MAQIQIHDSTESTDRSISYAFLIRVGSLALGSPFECARILLQIQHLPINQDIDCGEAFSDTASSASEKVKDTYSDSEQGEENGDETDDDLAEDFDLSRRDTFSGAFAQQSNILADEHGYIIQKYSEQLCPLRGGIWDAVFKIARSNKPGLGFQALWKGFTARILYDILKINVQKWMEEVFNEAFQLYDPSIVPLHLQPDYLPNLTTKILSITLAGVILSPLEIYRVLCMASASSSSSPVLRKMLGESGMPFIRRLFNYFYPQLPLCILLNFVRSFHELGTTLFVTRVMKIMPSTGIFYYGISVFLSSVTLTALSFPLETTFYRMIVYGSRHRRRVGNVLFSDNESLRKNFDTCVRSPEYQYLSSFQCVKSIITEESVWRTKPSSSRLKQLAGGVGQLFRGFLFHVCIKGILSVLAILSTIEIVNEEDSYYF